MIWTAMLLSIVGYSWYLVVANNMAAGELGLWTTGLGGLFLLAVLPTFLGLIVNRRMLALNPVVYQVVLANLILSLLYAGVIALGIFITYYLLQPPGELLARTIYLLPILWQGLSWLTGAYFGLNQTLVAGTGQLIGAKAVEISLALLVPAIFLLTFMEVSGGLLLAVIAGWFLSLVLTLAVEGGGFTSASVVRYDLIFIHALIPILVTVVIFGIFSAGGIHGLMVTAKQGLSAMLSYLVKLLELLFSGASPVEYDPSSNLAAFSNRPEGGERAGELPKWFVVPVLVVLALLLIPIVQGLTRLLQLRLSATSTLPGNREPFSWRLRRMGKWLWLVVKQLVHKCSGGFNLLKVWAEKLWLKCEGIIKRWLPPKTPLEQIDRSYEAFLRWGRQAGYPRRPAETPTEYMLRMQKAAAGISLPHQEISRLTQLFLEARYSNRPLTWHQGQQSKLLVNKIRGR